MATTPASTLSEQSYPPEMGEVFLSLTFSFTHALQTKVPDPFIEV